MLRRMFAAPLAVALALPFAADKPLSASELAKVEKAFDGYLREANPKKRASRLAPVKTLLPRLTCADIEALLAATVPGDEWPKGKNGFTHGIEFTSHGETFTYSVRLPPNRPKRSDRGGMLPLVVDPGHRSFADKTDEETEGVMSTWLSVSGAGDDVIYMRCRAYDALDRDERLDEWGAWTRPQGQENSDTLAAILLDGIADACRRFPVDPDRVFVHGMSMSAYWAWYAGALAPDRFAAVVPVGSATGQVMPLLDSFRATRVFILHGTNDEVCPFDGAKAAADALEAKGFPVVLRAVEGGGHVEKTFPTWRTLWPEVFAAVRDPYPKSVEKVFHGAERPAAFWLQARGRKLGDAAFDVRQPRCRMKGTVDGQTVTIEAAGMDELDVLLATRLLDPAAPVTIVVNGRTVFEKVAEPTPEEALAIACARGDGGAVGSAVVTVPVP
jgi:predicted esterase